MNELFNLPLTTAEQREDFLLHAVHLLIQGDINRGDVVKFLRKHLLKMNQSEFSALTKVSRRTLTEIENNTNGLNEDSLNRVFSVFGLKLGLVPISKVHANRLTSKMD